MKQFILLFIVTPVALLAGITSDSTAGKNPFSFGVNIGQPKRLPGGDYAPDEGPYFSYSGKENYQSLGAGVFARWYINNSVFLHGGVTHSIRSYTNYDSIPNEPYTYSSWDVTTSYGGYGVLEIDYNSANYSFELGAGYETELNRFRLRLLSTLNYIKYSDLGLEFNRRMYSFSHTDSTLTGGTFEDTRYFKSTETWVGPHLWGIGLNTAAELEFRICEAFGIGASAYFGATLTNLKDGQWQGDYKAIEDRQDTNGYYSHNEYTDELDLDLNVNRFEFSPITAQLNLTYHFGNQWFN